MIPPNEQVVEERKHSITIIPKGPSKYRPNELFPKVALMEKSYAQGTKGLKKTPKIGTFSDPGILTGQETVRSKPRYSERELN